MAFRFDQKVLFKHCDPAGIVFYPRYYEMLNDAVEALFEALGWPFAQMHPAHGIPTAQLDVRFTAPSRLGEALVFTLAPVRIGRSSLTLRTVARCDAETRLEADHVMVCVDGRTGRPMDWPETIRSGVTEMMEAQR